MRRQPRLYESVLQDHLDRHRQMVFVAGPRQVGKTTSCRRLLSGGAYLDWDDQDDRRLITRGPQAVAETVAGARLRASRPVVLFDEIHKYAKWRTFLKGLFDKHGESMRIIVTGSSRLDVYRRGGDSLMGRYLLYHMHPFSAGELLHTELSAAELRAPSPLSEAKWRALLDYGGFPEPFLKRDRRFARRWQQRRWQQLVREDVRDFTRIQELGQLDVLAALLRERSAAQLSYSNLAREVNIAVDTSTRWVTSLCSLHYGFLVRPWFRNVAKALRKEPKWYLRDWSIVSDPAARAETFVACHLLKAVQTWEDIGLGSYALHYLRDKQKREVDFVVVRDGAPWFLVEVKSARERLSPSLAHFQRQTAAQHAFQVVLDLEYVDADCFSKTAPVVVPARTFLSQLP